MLDLNRLADAFSWSEGFHRPDWESIYRELEKIPREEWNEAWREIIEQWLAKLAADLGGSYEVRQSANFYLVTELRDHDARRFLDFCESTQVRIEQVFGDAVMRGHYGKDVVLLFTEEDDYYQYISHYYPEGTHASSSGISIRDHCIHIALPFDERTNRAVLAHELAHNNLAHLPIPTWLNEGLALGLEGDVTGRAPESATDDMEEQQETWDDEQIQAFWAGAAFHDPDRQRQSYRLAITLVQILATQRGPFIEFIRHADWRDAGQSAAVDILGQDLGHVVAPFVSAERARPDRRAIAEYSRPAEANGDDPASGG